MRVPDHAVAQALLEELAEPLLSSTLIPAGETEPMNDPEAIRDRYNHALELIIDSGACHREPTTVVDLAVSPPAVVRLGRGDPARLGLDAPADVIRYGAGVGTSIGTPQLVEWQAKWI